MHVGGNIYWRQEAQNYALTCINLNSLGPFYGAVMDIETKDVNYN